MITKNKIKQFQDEILSWYEKNQRDLPWREVPFDTSLQQRDPYKILVSEVMSQQTQLSRVIPKYLAWMEELPTVGSLAAADKATVLRLWSGLGYNRRALFLQKAAQVIVKEYNGVWPEEPLELEKLPGIGKYTASAVACFAFDKQIPVVDTNVRKVILTKFPISNIKFQISSKKSEDKMLNEIAWQLLPKDKAYKWNQALMDYAALMLKGEKIPVPKQSKFLGSKRFYRGKVLKLLIKHTRLDFAELWQLIQDEQAGDEEWFRAILSGLIAEGFVHEKSGTYFL